MPLLKLPENTNPSGARVPDGMRVYAVGDMHGRVDLVRRLHDLIRADVAEVRDEATPAHKVIIYLGDFVDRGNGCKELIDLLLDDPLEGFTPFYLRGNHEARMLDFLEDPEIGAEWVFWGGETTLRGYGADIENPAFGQQGWSWVRDEFQRNMPARHLSFFRATRFSHSVGDYFFAHAGVRPGVALANQDARDLMWIRKEFLESNADFGQVVVHGHTIVDDVEVRPNRIAVDTGAWRSGKLSCLVLEENQRHVLQT